MTAAASDDAPRLRDRVAEEVRVALTRQRMSGAELARRIGRSQTFVAKRLDGRQPFDIDDLEMVGAVLGLPAASFFPTDSEDAQHPFRPAAPQTTVAATSPTRGAVRSEGVIPASRTATRHRHLHIVPSGHDSADVSEVDAA